MVEAMDCSEFVVVCAELSHPPGIKTRDCFFISFQPLDTAVKHQLLWTYYYEFCRDSGVSGL